MFARQNLTSPLLGKDRNQTVVKPLLGRLPCIHISALTPSVPLSQNWARGRQDKAFRLPFSQSGRRGWG